MHILNAALPPLPKMTNSINPTSRGDGWARFDLDVSIAHKFPGCYPKTSVLINGLSLPTIEVQSGSKVYINVINRIPSSYPSVVAGISIHWHGFTQYGANSWYDGVIYNGQCPIQPGTNFTYVLDITQPPGTYFWHDHSFAAKADGLQGALIVTPAPGMTEPFPSYDSDQVLFLTDNWHTDANVMAMRLNRAFDSAKVTNDTGSWTWVGNPQSILINEKGFYGDCTLYPGGGGGSAPPSCNASVFTVPPGRSTVQPWASDLSPGCTHETMIVQTNTTTRIRLISGAELVYMTVCFEGHNVSVVAADAVPIDPFPSSCVDINAGQRYDVLLTADKANSNYWISVHSQYRLGAPSGYGVLQYSNAPSGSFPLTPTPQPGVAPWSLAQLNVIRIHPSLTTAPLQDQWTQYSSLARGQSSLSPPSTSNRMIQVNVSQPIFNSTGILRWALNDISTPSMPVCTAIRRSIYNDPLFLRRFTSIPASYGTGQDSLNVSSGTSGMIKVIEYGRPAKTYPTVGIQLVKLTTNDVVDIVIQNNAANAFNGDYRVPDGAKRTAQEQHPFHLHGHHFWVLGAGLGVYSPTNLTQTSTLNLVNPVLRDTTTLPAGGWTLIRFVANNPGIWPLHCHLLWHHYMGQQLVFQEGEPREWAPPPTNFPTCPQTCQFNTAPYTNSYVQGRWGQTGYALPNP